MTTTQTVTFEEVAAFIGSASREEVDIMFELIRTRSKIISKITGSLNTSLLKEGDAVRIVGNIKPAYLRGRTATVFGPSATRKPGYIAIKLDAPARTYSSSTPIDFPAACLEKVG